MKTTIMEAMKSTVDKFGNKVALKTKINALFMVAFDHTAIGILAGALPASLAVRFGQIGQHFLKGRIVFKFGQEC